MTTLREAAQQALEAIEGSGCKADLMAAADALRAALAEQKCPCGDRQANQCPGEWEPGCDLGANAKYAKVACHVFNVTVSGSLHEWEPTTFAFALKDGKHALYTTPPAPQPLRDLCAAAYQVVGVAGGPVEMLDNLVAAADGKPLPHDPGAGLPWMPAPKPLAEQEDDLTAAWMAGAAEERKRAEQAQPDQALRWATQLAESLAQKHYPEVPQFKPLPDLVGVISQIDNMTCGLTRLPAPQPLTIERLQKALVGSRVVPPEAVEDPDNYDDGVMLSRIEALHRRIT